MSRAHYVEHDAAGRIGRWGLGDVVAGQTVGPWTVVLGEGDPATHCVVAGAIVERVHLEPQVVVAPGLATLTWPEPVTARVTWRGAPGPAEVVALGAAEPLELVSEVPDVAVVELDVPHRGRWEVAVP